MLRHLLCPMLLVSTIAGRVVAQAGPEATAQEYARAFTTGDWAGAARLMHPTALRQLMELFHPLLASPEAEKEGPQLFGVNSLEELEATPDTVLFANFLRTMLTLQEGLGDALKSSVSSPIGHVAGSGDTVYVVSRMRMTMDGVSITQFEVMPLLRENGRWWGLLKADFANMAAMLQRAMAPGKT